MQRVPFRYLVGLAAVGTIAAGGFLVPAQAADKSDCSKTNPVSVYQDGLAHYVGVCADGVGHVQVNSPTGGNPVEAGTPAGPVAAPSVMDHQDCSAATASVFTDGLSHFVGACIAGAYVRGEDLTQVTRGHNPVTVHTGVAPVDGVLATVPVDVNTNKAQCQPISADVLQVYTDALSHVLGACDPQGDSVQVNALTGALNGQNYLLNVRTGLFKADVQTQAQDGGTNLVVLHPKIVFTPTLPIPLP